MRAGLLTILNLLFSVIVMAQCIDENQLRNRITYLRDSSNVPVAQQKRELLGYLSNIQHCTYAGDSTHSLLLQRIGWLYCLDKDYVNAVNSSHASLDLVYKNISKPSTNYKGVVDTYNNLRAIYDSIGDYKLGQQARDSSLIVALRLHLGDPYYLLPTKTFELLVAGDYFNCIEFASIGQILCGADAKYAPNLPYYLIWKINSFILLKDFDRARELLNVALREFTLRGHDEFAGSFYGLQARMNEETGDEASVLRYVSKSLSTNKKEKQLNICAQVLNNVGYFLYFGKLKQNRIALSYYRQALTFADSTEALNIYENMANVYIVEKNFDSAFYFFQKSFDQIKPGINELDLLSESETLLFDKKADFFEYVSNLLLDKADAYIALYRTNRDPKIC